MPAGRVARVASRLCAHPLGLSAALYVCVVAAILGPALLPGHTVAPLDILTVVQPWAHLAGRPPSYNPIVSDAAFQFAPWMEFLSNQLHHGNLPSWNPYLLAGSPDVPSGFIAPYYPPFLLAGIFSAERAYTLFVALHLVLGALGVRWLSREVGARHGSAAVAGLGALVCGAWVHWSLHLVHLVGMVGTPWFLAALHRTFRSPTPRSAVILGVVFGLWWSGANPQFAYYGVLTGAVWVLCLLALRWRAKGRQALVAVVMTLGIGGVLGSGLAAATLLPTAAASPRVLRSHETQDSVTVGRLSADSIVDLTVPESRGDPVDHVSTSDHPDFPLDTVYVGAVAVVLALTGLVGARADPRRVVLGGMGFGVLALCFLKTPNDWLYDVVPGYDLFRAVSRWTSVLPALVLPLAALGIDDLVARRRAARTAGTVIAVLGLLATGGWSLWVWDRHAGSYLAERGLWGVVLLLGVATVAAASARWRRPEVVPALCGALVLVEVLLHTPAWYPDHTQRHDDYGVAQLDDAAARPGRLVRVSATRTPLPGLPPDVPLARGISDVQALLVLFPKATDRYLRLIDDYGDFARGANANPPLARSSMVSSPLVRALDVSTVVLEDTDEPVGLPPGAERLAGETPAVFAVPSLGPATLVRTAVPSTESGAWTAIADPSWDPGTTAHVEGLSSSVDGEGGAVRFHRIDSDRERYVVTSAGGGFLRVSGAWDPGWHVRVDGRAARVHRADGLFRGVIVPAGRHVVEWSYANPDESRGRRISAVSILLMAALLVGPSVRRRRPRGGR